MNCPTCDNPMVRHDETGEMWCSVYGTHLGWPWPREWKRMNAKSDATVKTMIDDRIAGYPPQIHRGLTPLCTSVPQGRTETMMAGGLH